MKKFNVVWVLIGCTACVFCARQSSKEKTITAAFSLSGEVRGYQDSTWFYIQDISGTLLDSAMIDDGRFKFRAYSPTEGWPDMVIMATRNAEQAVVLWLENKPMTVHLEKGKLQDAIVTGSVTHSEWNELTQATKTLYRTQDSVLKTYIHPQLSDHEKAELNTAILQFREYVKQSQIDFIKLHPNSFLSASLLDGNSKAWGKELTAELLNSLTDTVKNSHYGQKVSAFVLLNQELTIGDKFVDIEQTDPNGVTQKLSKFRGNVILLEFWAGWCGPCRKENPILKATYAIFNPKGFEIYAVSLDFKKEQWTKAIEADHLPWTHVSELNRFKNSAAQIYGIDAIPDNILIDQNGTIVARGLHGEELTKKLKELLN